MKLILPDITEIIFFCYGSPAIFDLVFEVLQKKFEQLNKKLLFYYLYSKKADPSQAHGLLFYEEDAKNPQIINLTLVLYTSRGQKNKKLTINTASLKHENQLKIHEAWWTWIEQILEAV